MGSCSGSPAPSPRLNPPHVAQLLIGSTGLLGVTVTLDRPPRGPSQGAWRCNAGDWGPQPQRWPHPAAQLLPGSWGPALHSGRENGRDPPKHGDLQRTPAPKRPGPRSRPPALSTRSATPLSTQLANRACWPPRGYPNPMLAPKVPLPRGLAPERGGLGIPEPQRLTHPAAPPPLGLLGALPVIQEGEWAWPAESPETFEGPQHQNAWAHAPAPQRPHLDPPLLSPHSWRIEPAGVPGAKPNPRSSPEGLLPSDPVPQCGGLGTLEPQRQTHLPPRHHPGH